jgi:hypothetical protein
MKQNQTSIQQKIDEYSENNTGVDTIGSDNKSSNTEVNDDQSGIDVDYSGQVLELSVKSVVNCIENQYNISIPRTHVDAGINVDNPELFAISPLCVNEGYIQYGDLTTTLMDSGQNNILKPIVYYNGFKYTPEISSTNEDTIIDRIDNGISTTDGNYNINITVESYGNITPQTVENEYMIVDSDVKEEQLSDILNISDLAYTISIDENDKFTYLVSDSDEAYSISATKTEKDISLVQSKELSLDINPININPSEIDTEELYKATLLYTYETNRNPYEIAYNTEDEHFSIIDNKHAYTVDIASRTIEEQLNGLGIDTYHTKYNKIYSKL